MDGWKYGYVNDGGWMDSWMLSRKVDRQLGKQMIDGDRRMIDGQMIGG